MLADIIAGILEVLITPLRRWRDDSSSIVGESEYDKETRRFWRWVVWIVVVVLLVGVFWVIF